MRSRDTILIMGCGELGGILLEYLCRIPGIGNIVVADTNEVSGKRKVNSALHGASFMGLYPSIRFVQVNLLETDKTAAILSEINPAVIFNSTTLQSWWVVNEIPPAVNARLYRPKVGLGAWVPMHLALTALLMRAVTRSGIDTHVVNASFPDVTNVALSKIGQGPTVGIGNGSLLVPYIQKAAAAVLNTSASAINVELIAHHYHCYNWARSGTGAEVPHYLRVYEGLQDVTEQMGDMTQFIASLPVHGERPGGRGGQYLVAASALRVILDIYNDTNALGMAPGPQGLEGAYPVRLNRAGAKVVLPKGMSLTTARGLMIQAQQYDGISEILGNGDIVLTNETKSMYEEELGISWNAVTIENSFEQAMELKEKFKEFLKKNNVIVPQ